MFNIFIFKPFVIFILPDLKYYLYQLINNINKKKIIGQVM